MKKIIIWIVILIIMIFGVYYVLNHNNKDSNADQDMQTTATVKIIKAKSHIGYASIQADGQINVMKHGIDHIVMHGNGIVKSVLVSSGDAIRKGQLLIEIIPSSSELADLKDARDNYLHQLHLRKLYLATNLVVHQAHNKWLSLKSKYGNGYRWIKAPFDGVVSHINYQSGQAVADGAAMTTLYNMDDMGAKVYLTPKQARLIKDNNKAVITVANHHYQAAVTNVPGLADMKTGLITGQLKLISNNMLPAFFGQPITAIIYYGSKLKVIMVPRNAVLFDGSKAYLYLSKHHSAVKHYVKIIDNINNQTMLDARGLANSDIVVDGNYVLQPNMPIQTKVN